MAALLRQGARRIGGSVFQRAQAAVTSPAVAQERRRLLPRRMTTDEKANAMEIQQQKEELYEALSKAPKVEKWRNRRLLQNLAVHVNPRKRDKQWQSLRASKWFTNVVRAAGSVSFAYMLVIGLEGVERYVEEKKKIALTLMKLEKEHERDQEQGRL